MNSCLLNKIHIYAYKNKPLLLYKNFVNYFLVGQRPFSKTKQTKLSYPTFFYFPCCIFWVVQASIAACSWTKKSENATSFFP